MEAAEKLQDTSSTIAKTPSYDMSLAAYTEVAAFP